jgi:hypothetical protein
MDPDLFVTVAFSGYAVFVALGIGVVLRVTSRQHHGGRDDDVR